MIDEPNEIHELRSALKTVNDKESREEKLLRFLRTQNSRAKAVNRLQEIVVSPREVFGGLAEDMPEDMVKAVIEADIPEEAKQFNHEVE